MNHFLLLHGAWHGSWVWQPLAKKLHAAGHSVEAPDFAGLGERCNELNKSIGLKDHIASAIPKQPSIVVAHSYAGVPVRAALHEHAELFTRLVLIESLWPDDQQSAMDCLSPSARNHLQQQIETHGDGWLIPPANVEQFHIKDKSLQSWVAAKLSPHPAATFQQKVSASTPKLKGDYLISNDRDPQPYSNTAQRLAKAGWTIHSIPGGHNLMLTNTDAMFDIITTQANATE